MPVIQKFLDRFFPKWTTPSEKHIIGLRCPSSYAFNTRGSCDTEERVYISIKVWHCIGFYYKGLFDYDSKPILQIYDCDYIPFDGKSVISRTTQFDIMNENYLMEELNAKSIEKAPRDIRGL